jgi:alpha-ketoglutarate-dependent taurine dioxygenase
MGLAEAFGPSDLPQDAQNWPAWTDEQLLKNGAILLRGFEVPSPQSFEEFALLLDPKLYEVYRGTAPREAKTRYVHSSTELAAYLPIPQHLEMSFLPGAPQRLFFYCHVPPGKHGETPLVDFQRLAEDMPAEMRKAFSEKGIRHVRNYNPPGKSWDVDLSKLKTWDKVYGTEESEEIKEKCEAEGQEYEFRKDGSLKLVNSGPAFRAHPQSGKDIWFNHAQVFHPEGPVREAELIAKRQGTFRQRAFAMMLRNLHRVTSLFLKDELRGTQVTYADGSVIPPSYIRKLQDLIWKHMLFFPWQQGDVLVIDNYRVSHGRMPFYGEREIMVAWTK